MDVRTILIVPSNRVLGTALPLIDVLGSSVLQRTIDRLRTEIESEVTVVADSTLKTIDLRGARVVGTELGAEWRAAEHVFAQDAQEGADVVLVACVNAYTEVNWAEMLDHHLSAGSRITRLHHGEEPTDIFLLNGARRNEAAALLRSEMQRSRSQYSVYRSDELFWPLQSAGDLRALAVDALFRRCRLAPIGEEVRPGIWMGRNAYVERGARLVAPVYIGEFSRVYTGAVITRASALEHHSRVDCGTVVENSTVAPYSFVGAGLDLVSVLVGNTRICHLRKNCEIGIFDRKLLRAVSTNAGVRLVASTASLLSLLPAVAAARLRRKRPGVTAMPRRSPLPAHSMQDAEHINAEPKRLDRLSAAYAVMRRYGNQ